MDVKKGLLLTVCSDLLTVNFWSILIPMEKLFRLRISNHNTRNLGYFNLQVRKLNELLAGRLCFFQVDVQSLLLPDDPSGNLSPSVPWSYSCLHLSTLRFCSSFFSEWKCKTCIVQEGDMFQKSTESSVDMRLCNPSSGRLLTLTPVLHLCVDNSY